VASNPPEVRGKRQGPTQVERDADQQHNGVERVVFCKHCGPPPQAMYLSNEAEQKQPRGYGMVNAKGMLRNACHNGTQFG
jgi:hypothetical protein